MATKVILKQLVGDGYRHDGHRGDDNNAMPERGGRRCACHDKDHNCCKGAAGRGNIRGYAIILAMYMVYILQHKYLETKESNGKN